MICVRNKKCRIPGLILQVFLTSKSRSDHLRITLLTRSRQDGILHKVWCGYIVQNIKPLIFLLMDIYMDILWLCQTTAAADFCHYIVSFRGYFRFWRLNQDSHFYNMSPKASNGQSGLTAAARKHQKISPKASNG